MRTEAEADHPPVPGPTGGHQAEGARGAGDGAGMIDLSTMHPLMLPLALLGIFLVYGVIERRKGW